MAIIAFCVWALWSSFRTPAPAVVMTIPTPECSPQSLPPSYFNLNNSLRAFDDALLLAVNLPREQVVPQVERLQELRRAVEAEMPPACMQTFKDSLLVYMNRVLELLVAFVGGAGPDSVMRGLTEAAQLRLPIQEQIGLLLGATVTPYPTTQPLPLGTEDASLIIPATGAARAHALVTHTEGVNLRLGPGVTFGFEVVLAPGTQVAVIGTDATQQWLLVTGPAGEQGWVFLPLVTLDVPVEELPLVE